MENFYLYKDDNGVIQRATAGEPVERTDLQAKVNAATLELRKWTDALAKFDALAGTAKPEGKPALTGVEDDDGHVTFEKVIPVI